MSSATRKVGKKIVNQRVHVTFQVLTILEQEAKKKNFFKRLRICFRYLFFKKFDAFFEE